MQPIFITGGTGYLGRRLITELLRLGHPVTALVRKGSERRLPAGAQPVIAHPFDASSFSSLVPANCVYIQLLGTPHPSPRKKALFYSVDLASARASAEAAIQAGAAHILYVSVAQYPTKVMADYQQARRQGEAAITATGIPATIFRPWYITGPGHYWPLLFQPLFLLLQHIPATSEKAKALALVPLRKMLRALVEAATQPGKAGLRIVEIGEINQFPV